MLYKNIFVRMCIKLIKPNIYYNGRRNLSKNLYTKYTPFDVLTSTIQTAKINSVDDWANIRKTILEQEFNRGQYTEHNIDANIINICTTKNNYSLGSSYIAFLEKENIKLNLATVGGYLRLLYTKNEGVCPKKEEKIILNYYEGLRKEYNILDSFTLDSAILALSITTQWRKCIDLVQEMKICTVPSVLAYSAVISAAFLNEDEELAWKLLKEMSSYDKTPTSNVFLSYFRSIKKIEKKEDVIKKLGKLFLFFQENNLICDQEVAVELGNLAKKYGFARNYTNVTYVGTCKNCNGKLNKFELSSEEFLRLKDNLFQNAIIGKDVFIRSNPEELEMFKKFVKNMDRFDAVLDGLNIAYSRGIKQSTEVLSSLVAAVVSSFVKQNKKVLVLGRMHMNNWPANNWNYIKANSTIFLTRNISQDDPYLLYCALNSGENTIIVTRDLMRTHKFLLGKPELKILFDRWLVLHQYQLIRVDKYKGPIFRYPPNFSPVAQKNGNYWHIPYLAEDPINKGEFYKTWLCLSC